MALVHPPPRPLRGVEEGRGSLAQGEKKKKPHYLCHQLVAADDVQSVNDHAAARYTRVHTGSLSAEQVAEPAPCPCQHIFFLITPSVSFLGRGGGRREEGRPLLNSVAVTGSGRPGALNFKQNVGGSLGSGVGDGERQRGFGAVWDSAADAKPRRLSPVPWV